MSRGRKPIVYDNKTVAKWLIETRYKNLDSSLKTKLPSFVDDAVYGGLYIHRGEDNNPTLSVTPEMIFRCLMLNEISVQSVETICSGCGYTYAERTIRRIAQITRFVAKGIELRIAEYEELHEEMKEEDKMFDWKLEKQFIWCYYNNVPSRLYSNQLPQIPEHITALYHNKQYQKYLKELIDWRRSI